MQPSGQRNWWIVSVIDQDTRKIVMKDIDAVLSEDAGDAQVVAGWRNPRRVNQVFGLKKATVWEEKNAVLLNERRSNENRKFEQAMSD